jgi:ATP phosphoribosyltransferase regulatory subunit
VHLDLGHVGIYRELSAQAGLTTLQETELFDVLQRKAKTELVELMEAYTIEMRFKPLFLKLIELNGDYTVLTTAREIFANAGDKINQALADLQAIADKLAALFPSLPINFDLAELRGYHYHTGMVFAAFMPNVGREIARGGRYDNIGKTFGRARPATGFSADLKLLVALSKTTDKQETPAIIFAPWVEDDTLLEAISTLRAQGQVVIQQLPHQVGGAQELGCNFVLEKHNQNWHMLPLI